MIVTVTPNPSIDRTVTLPAQLVRGAVHRVVSVSTEPGGKGVNVARALTLAGIDTVAVLPAGEHDPILTGLQSNGVAFHAVPVDGTVRTNLTITESDGTTTKINEPGAVMAEAALALTAAILARAARRAGWCCPDPCPPACPTAGTPTWSRAAALRLQGRGGYLRRAAGRAGRRFRPGRTGSDQTQRRGARRPGRGDAGVAGERRRAGRRRAGGERGPPVDRTGRRHGAGHPRRGRCCAGRRDRQLAGHPSADQAPQHRRRR